MITVRHWIRAVALAILAVTTARLAVAQTPTSKGKTLLMQTAFNPNLPGAGEAVRTFAKSIKRMSSGGLVIKVVEPGRVVPTPDMLDAVISGDLEAAFTWNGYAARKSAVCPLFGTVPFGTGPDDLSA
jgi:TRAP-type mannitol/chloroaromatic compound transport system substrate-binding protein